MKKQILTAITLLGVCMHSHALILQTKVVQGEISGVEHNGAALYKRIPYAEPPVGPLRWKAPVTKKNWEGVYRSDEWGNRPPQPTDPNQGGGGLPMSEDCLYLSVTTPASTPSEKLPVFVMIHGGGFLTGSYSGTQDSFVKEGIIYVSIEYRLGALGFMCHPALNKESERGISGNYGIMDQIMALQWIHDNIAAFGGDPDKVTIAGESAGGISVSILCGSPLCKGLFRGAISESGSSFWPVAESRNGNTGLCSVNAASADGEAFQRQLGKKNIKQMRAMDFKTIVDSTKMDCFWPVVDGYVITDDQYKLYEKGIYNDVNVIIGFNSDEGSMFSWPMPVEAYRNRIEGIYGDWADRIYQLYPVETETDVRYALADIFCDGSFAWGTYAWANLQSRTGKGKVYMYYFDQDSENTILRSPRGGASHVAEMPFIYGYDFGGKSRMTPVEQHMEQIMSRYWINFTKTGNPNSDCLPYWTEYEQGKNTLMIMRNGFSLGEMPNQNRMDFFEEFFRSRRK
ncbi:MAG: carboxylesterase family protein [Muribaculaceae bacterium]|nr:carboxylesterase family protein [Muribaculaceae bacterium]